MLSFLPASSSRVLGSPSPGQDWWMLAGFCSKPFHTPITITRMETLTLVLYLRLHHGPWALPGHIRRGERRQPLPLWKAPLRRTARAGYTDRSSLGTLPQGAGSPEKGPATWFLRDAECQHLEGIYPLPSSPATTNKDKKIGKV